MSKIVNTVDAAGIILVRDPGKKVLIIKSVDGTWDLPKGHIDEGENVFTCAKRETYEETSIKNIEFLWGKTFITFSSIAFFVALTDEDPEFKPNPETKFLEHLEHRWVTFNEAIGLLPSFMAVPVLWAEGIITGNIVR